MINYNNSKIYKIVCNKTQKIYYGSTTEFYISRRLSKHKNDYKNYLLKKKNYISCYEVLKNNDFYIELVEKVNCNSIDELYKRERYYIENFDCVNKYIPGRTRKEYKKDNKEYIDKQNKKYRETTLKFRNSWGGDSRNSNNLLKIDINLFN